MQCTHCTTCTTFRGRQPAEDPERQHLLGDQLPQQHSIQQQDEEGRNDADCPIDRAELVRRVQESPYIGSQWANPAARNPPQPQSSGNGSTASSTSRLFEALVDMPPPRKRVSPEGSGYCS